MAINKDEQGGIEFKHSKARIDAEEKAKKEEAKNAAPAKVTKPAAPKESQDIIERGGKPVKVDIPKTLGNTDQNKCKDNVMDVEMFGDDLFKLLSKASSEKEGWMKSTKAMDVGKGCVVQVTTQQLNKDGTYSLAEAATFVPGVRIVENTDSEGEVTGRFLAGKS